MRRVYLERDQVPDILRRGYDGRKFDAVVGTTVTFTNTNWDSGSRSRYYAVRLTDGEESRRFGGSDMPAPWSNPVEGKTVEIPRGVVWVEHCIFQGKDFGLTFYVRPEDSAPLLPEASSELTDAQRIVLIATRSLKNSYGGRRDIRFRESHAETGITREMWSDAVDTLIGSGHLRKNASITPKGRNAAGDDRLESYTDRFRSEPLSWSERSSLRW